MRTHVAVALLSALALLAGCDDGGSGDVTDAGTATPTSAATQPSTEGAGASHDPEALHRVADAAAATAEEGTVRFEVTVATENTAGEDGTQPVSAEGEEDFAAAQRQVTFHAPGGDLEAIVDDSDVYVQLPATEDDTWARVELDNLIVGNAGFGGPAGLPFRSSQDNLQLLQDAVTRAAAGGTEEIDGDSTTRYDLTVDLEQAAQNAVEANDTAAALAEQSGVSELDMQVWVDDSDLIRRVAYSLDLGQADVEGATEGAEVDADASGLVTVTLEYFDFGADVTIDVPDEDAIVDLDESAIRDSMTAPGGSSGTPTESPS